MISDDDLLLYYYRDGLDAAARTRIGAALADQPQLAQRLHRLVSRLDAAAAIPEVPVPAEVRQRWHAALALAAQHQTTAAPVARRRFAIDTRWLAAAAVVLIASASIFQFTRQQPVQQVAAGSAYERGLKSHLASTETLLASLGSATPEERKRLVESIIEQNRIYALAAERAGEPQLARVLRAFSPLLEGLQQGGDTSASLDQLEFELRVMQGRLGAGHASAPHSTAL